MAPSIHVTSFEHAAGKTLVVLARGCLVPDVVNTVAITAIQAQQLARGEQS